MSQHKHSIKSIRRRQSTSWTCHPFYDYIHQSYRPPPHFKFRPHKKPFPPHHPHRPKNRSPTRALTNYSPKKARNPFLHAINMQRRRTENQTVHLAYSSTIASHNPDDERSIVSNTNITTITETPRRNNSIFCQEGVHGTVSLDSYWEFTFASRRIWSRAKSRTNHHQCLQYQFQQHSKLVRLYPPTATNTTSGTTSATISLRNRLQPHLHSNRTLHQRRLEDKDTYRKYAKNINVLIARILRANEMYKTDPTTAETTSTRVITT